MPAGHPVGVPTRRRGLLAASSVVLLVLVGSSCGSDPGSSPADSPSATAPTATDAVELPAPDPGQALPANDVGTLRQLYDPLLATMGLRLTRGELIDTSNDGYTSSDTGTHLALYVEPLDDGFTTAAYVEGLWTVSAALTPDVFARWSGLASYDICQEPPPSVDDRDEPLPYTQINLTRESAAAVDWADGDLATLIAAARTDGDFDLVVAGEIRQSPEYADANREAAELVEQILSD